MQSAAPLFAGRGGPAPCFVCGARIGRRARGPRQRPRAHSSVHLGVGPRILLATREISPFSSCLQCGYKSGIFFITFFFLEKKLHLGSFFCARLFHLFPSLLRCCFLISSTKIFSSGVYLIGSPLSSSPPPPPSLRCECRCRRRCCCRRCCCSPRRYTNPRPFVSPLGSVEFLC